MLWTNYWSHGFGLVNRPGNHEPCQSWLEVTKPAPKVNCTLRLILQNRLHQPWEVQVRTMAMDDKQKV